MINPGKNHLPGMLLFLDFSKIPVGVGVPDKLEVDEPTNYFFSLTLSSRISGRA